MNSMHEQMAETIRAYHQKGWSPATSTNYSFRQDGNPAIIHVSRSGVDKSQFAAADFIEVDLNGSPTPAYQNVKPSAETMIHCILYGLIPETGVILHSHSVYSVLNSQHYDQEITFAGYEIQKGFAGQLSHEAEVSIPIIDNSQNMAWFEETLKKIQNQLGNHCFIIRNHGTYAWGKNLFEAKRHLETLEYLLEVNWKLRKQS